MLSARPVSSTPVNVYFINYVRKFPLNPPPPKKKPTLPRYHQLNRHSYNILECHYLHPSLDFITPEHNLTIGISWSRDYMPCPLPTNCSHTQPCTTHDMQSNMSDNISCLDVMKFCPALPFSQITSALRIKSFCFCVILDPSASLSLVVYHVTSRAGIPLVAGLLLTLNVSRNLFQIGHLPT